MSRSCSNTSTYESSWDEKTEWEDSYDVSASTPSPKSIVTSRVSLESSSSQSDCIPPPPPPDSDSCDESTHCSSECDDSPITNRSRCSVFGASNTTRGLDPVNHCTRPIDTASSHCSAKRSHHDDFHESCSTAKSTTQSFGESELKPTGDECSYDDDESCLEENGILSDLFDLLPVDDRPPVYNASSDLSKDSSRGIKMQTSVAKTYGSNEEEMNRWIMWRRMHWKHSCSSSSDYKPMESSLKKRRMPLELSRQVFGIMEHIEAKVILRLAFQSLKTRSEQRKQFCNAAVQISRTFQKVLMRVTLRGWVNKQRAFLSKQLAVNNYASKSRSRLLRRFMHSWKGYTINAIKKRQHYFLMVIFNRWRTETEERLEDKEKEIVALMHWAATLCLKAFNGLRGYTQKSKELKRRNSYSCPNRYLSPLTNANSNAPASMRTWGDVHRPFSISYRSPERSMVLNRTPDVFSHLSMTQTDSQLLRERGIADKKWGTSRYNSGGLIQRGTKHKESDLPHGYRHEKCKGFEPAQQVDQNTLSRNLNVSLPSRGFGFDSASQTISAHTHNAPLTPNHGNSMTQFQYPFSRNTLAERRGAAYETSTLFRAQMPRCMWAGTQHKIASNSQVGPSFLISGGLFSNPSHSVKSMKDFYKDRFEISALLDEMVTRVEHMWQLYQPIHRYAGYAGCDEELYHRL